MNMAAALEPEWERIDILGACLSASRQGNAITEQISMRLSEVQKDVNTLRQNEPWKTIANEYGLHPIDQDILCCSLAPEAEPRLGWMYQQLQSGVVSPYPTPALIREMFVMNAQESAVFNERLSQHSPLLRSGMIESQPADIFYPVRPSARARSELLGWALNTQIEIPGAVEVPVSVCWDDLVLPSYCLKKLHEYILWVTHRQQVEQRWGARVNGGPVALFSGPSGTGKTFTAQVLANALGWKLFRVDLGLLVSKYIGETEKNMNALFDAAHGQAVVLLFDEADSLFARRGEVKEARDRYANMEVSHLLSRIERHNGPCILTTNLRQHIDSAFLRRFQVVVDFPRPDANAREKLWRLHIPPKAPCDLDDDYKTLGKEFNLSGGQIKNAALHAAFLAAGDASSIGLPHVASAVWTELSKKGGELSRTSLGELAKYLPTGKCHD